VTDPRRLDEMQAAWRALAAQGVALSEEVLVGELQRRAGTEPARIADLALAIACQHRDDAAIAVFERTHLAMLEQALRRLKINPAIADDVLGWIRFELFVRPPPPLIATYAGRGDLRSWVRAIGVHEALKRTRRARREVSPELAPEIPVPEPELVAMRGAYGPAFTRALSAGFAALTTAERNLLRQYFLDGLTIDVLAELYQIHRATAARRVAAARERLVANVRTTLTRELALSEASVDQIITLSNLDESLGTLLRRTR
jgi:RNA polymerase sigma-70 factor (ECF subfamily)